MISPSVRLSDVTTKIGSGITPRGGSAVYKKIGRPFVRSQNVGWGTLRLDDITFIDEVTHQTFPGTEIRTGDVLLNITGASIGRAAVATTQLNGGNVNQHVCEIRLKQGRMDPRFVSSFLLSRPGQDQIDTFQAGGNRQGLNFQQVGSIEVPDLDIGQQRAIGVVIDDLDSLIATLERLIAKKQAIKQGMMQQLLTGRTRLPGFTSEWALRRIGDFAQVKAGGTPSTREHRYWGGDIRWMSSGEIHAKRVYEVEGRITADGLAESAAQLLPAGTVLMALAGQGKTRGTVAVSRVALSTNQSIAGILPSDTHDPDFLYYNLDARYVELRGESSGDGGRGGLNLTIIKTLEVSMPSRREQSAIARVLTDADDEIDLLKRRLAKARDLKTGMMQQLLTGQARLDAGGVS